MGVRRLRPVNTIRRNCDVHRSIGNIQSFCNGSPLPAPKLPVQRAILDGFSDVGRRDVLRSSQVGYRPRHFQQAVVGAGGETPLAHAPSDFNNLWRSLSFSRSISIGNLVTQDIVFLLQGSQYLEDLLIFPAESLFILTLKAIGNQFRPV
jgi:hypothetical protein